MSGHGDRSRRSLPALSFGALLYMLGFASLIGPTGATARANAHGPIVSLAPPPDDIVGPGSGLEMVWAITNHTDGTIRVALEVAAARSWPLSFMHSGYLIRLSSGSRSISARGVIAR